MKDRIVKLEADVLEIFRRLERVESKSGLSKNLLEDVCEQIDKSQKNLLFICASSDVDVHAIAEKYCNAKLYGINFQCFDVCTLEELKCRLDGLDGKKIDYLYLAGHGNCDAFGDINRFTASWEDIADTICEAECLNEGTIVMLYCCRGGLNTVAYKLFSSCININYILGAKQNMADIDLITGFNVFLYNVECRNIDPVIAAQKATIATEIRFECFDRTEAEANPLYIYKYSKDFYELHSDMLKTLEQHHPANDNNQL